jgi:hypothetical protein
VHVDAEPQTRWSKVYVAALRLASYAYADQGLQPWLNYDRTFGAHECRSRSKKGADLSASLSIPNS